MYSALFLKLFHTTQDCVISLRQNDKQSVLNIIWGYFYTISISIWIVMYFNFKAERDHFFYSLPLSCFLSCMIWCVHNVHSISCNSKFLLEILFTSSTEKNITSSFFCPHFLTLQSRLKCRGKSSYFLTR